MVWRLYQVISSLTLRIGISRFITDSLANSSSWCFMFIHCHLISPPCATTSNSYFALY